MKKLLLMLMISLVTIVSFTQVKSDSIFMCSSSICYVFPIKSGDKEHRIIEGDLVKVIDFDSSGMYYKVKTSDNFIGYISKNSLKLYADVLKRKKEISKNNGEIVKNKKNKLVEKYGDVNGQRILDHKIWIGMTKEMCKESGVCLMK